MPRARSRSYDDWREQHPQYQTAAAEQQQGSGCLSGFMIPPLAVLLISGFLAVLALRQPVPAQALAPLPTSPVQASLPASLPAGGVSGQQPAVPLYDGSGQLIAATPEAALQAPPPQNFVVELTPTPAQGFFPQIQAAIVTALAQENTEPSELAAPSSTGLAPFFRPEVLYWGEHLLRWSAEAGVDPNLAAVVMQIESCGDPTARSRSGAMGLFQVMPFHFVASDNPYDPDTNALRGLNYLARSLKTSNGDARLALAGYNGGIGVISRGEWSWPAETLRYIYFGAPMYEDARRGLLQSSALDEWYSKYGVSLCRQASQHQ